MSVEKCGDLVLKTELVDETQQPSQEAHQTLTESQINELKTAFSMLDRNQDGRVNLGEMKAMLTGLGICPQEGVVEALIHQASEKGDGLVSEEEFLSWMGNQEEFKAADNDVMEDLLAAFRVFDKDGNGYITKDELKLAMDLIGEKVTEAELEEMLKASDTDHDGKINYEEFVKILL